MAERTARHRRRPAPGAPAADALRRLDRAGVADPAALPPVGASGRAGSPVDGVVAGWLPTAPPPVPAPVVPSSRAARSRAAVADRLPVGWRAALSGPSRRALAGLLLLVCLAVAAAAVSTWLARPREQPVPVRPRTVGSPVALTPAASQVDAALPGDPATPAASSVVFVHVAGAVRRPGLVELPAGSRVADAVEAAGGPSRRAATASVNLARPLVDGEQVLVLRRGDPGSGVAGAVSAQPPGVPAGAGTPGGSPGPPLDLNAATLEQLDGLPGIGPVLAQRILDWRTTNGRFTAVDELAEVKGIGEATLSDLRPAVRV